MLDLLRLVTSFRRTSGVSTGRGSPGWPPPSEPRLAKAAASLRAPAPGSRPWPGDGGGGGGVVDRCRGCRYRQGA
jgi:hypothetical protein